MQRESGTGGAIGHSGNENQCIANHEHEHSCGRKLICVLLSRLFPLWADLLVAGSTTASAAHRQSSATDRCIVRLDGGGESMVCLAHTQIQPKGAIACFMSILLWRLDDRRSINLAGAGIGSCAPLFLSWRAPGKRGDGRIETRRGGTTHSDPDRANKRARWACPSQLSSLSSAGP